MSFFNAKTILVTGAGGSIGSELVRELLLERPKKLVLFDNSELALYNVERRNRRPCVEAILGDITEVTDVSYLFYEHDFDIVFHAAAYKHVALCEKNPGPAARVNIYGTRLLVEHAAANEVPRFILISTDKAVRPTCIMGSTKQQAEEIVRAANYTVVRLGNVWGSSGSVVPLWQEQISEGKPVTITDPGALRYFITAREAAQRIIQATTIAVGGEVLVPDMDEPRRIYDIAVELGAERFDFIGLRPGEKRKEELFVGERACTNYPGIWRDAA